MIEIESVRRLDVKPGDVIVLNLAAPPTEDDRDEIYEQMRQLIPNGAKFMLLGPGMDISLLNAEQLAEAVEAHG